MTALKRALAALGLWMLLLTVFATGCGTRTVLVPPGEPVRLRAPVKGVKVWAADAKGVEVPGKVDLPEGWWAAPPPSKAKPVSEAEFLPAPPKAEACDTGCFAMVRNGVPSKPDTGIWSRAAR